MAWIFSSVRAVDLFLNQHLEIEQGREDFFASSDESDESDESDDTFLLAAELLFGIESKLLAFLLFEFEFFEVSLPLLLSVSLSLKAK